MAEETFKDRFYAAIDAAKATDEEMAEEFKTMILGGAKQNWAMTLLQERQRFI